MEDLCCTLLRGTIYLRNLSGDNPLLPVGNVTSFSVSHEITEVEVANYESLGGRACYLPFIDSASLEMNISCLKARNWALAVSGEGEYENVTAGSVEDEAHTARAAGELIIFDNLPDTEATITVTDSSGSTTYVEGTDYAVTQGGIEILEGSTMSFPEELLITYDYGANTLISALTESSAQYEVVFKGVNYGEGDQRPFVFQAYKVRFTPSESLDLISDEFAQFTVSGEVLKTGQSNKTSDFYQIEFGKKAS